MYSRYTSYDIDPILCYFSLKCTKNCSSSNVQFSLQHKPRFLLCYIVLRILGAIDSVTALEGMCKKRRNTTT